MEVVGFVFQGMPSLLKDMKQLDFDPQWPLNKELPSLPMKNASINIDLPLNLLKLLPQKRKRMTKCRNCPRRTYENTKYCRKCYSEQHGELKRRCAHLKSKLYARGLCRQCYFTFYNHNIRQKS